MSDQQLNEDEGLITFCRTHRINIDWLVTGDAVALLRESVASRRMKENGEIDDLFKQWLALEREAIEHPECTPEEDDDYTARRESLQTRLLSLPPASIREMCRKIIVDTYFGAFAPLPETYAEVCAFAGISVDRAQAAGAKRD